MKEKIEKALELIESYGGIDGGHHKQWVLDQIVRVLVDDYEQWIKEYAADGYARLHIRIGTGVYDDRSVVEEDLREAHLAGQAVGEKRGYEEVIKEIQRLISIGHAEVGVMQNLYGWLKSKVQG